MSWTYKLDATVGFDDREDKQREEDAWQIITEARDKLTQLGLSVCAERQYREMAFADFEVARQWIDHEKIAKRAESRRRVEAALKGKEAVEVLPPEA